MKKKVARFEKYWSEAMMANLNVGTVARSRSGSSPIDADTPFAVAWTELDNSA